jgi:hypothetical protein
MYYGWGMKLKKKNNDCCGRKYIAIKRKYNKMKNVLHKTAFIYCFKMWSLRADTESGILWPVVGLESLIVT